MYPFLPESPKYLYLIKNNHIRAIKEIQRLRGKHLTAEYIENEIFKKEDTATNDCETMSLLSVLKDPALRLPLILVCCLQGGQQLSGINAVCYIRSIHKYLLISEFKIYFDMYYLFLNL